MFNDSGFKIISNASVQNSSGSVGDYVQVVSFVHRVNVRAVVIFTLGISTKLWVVFPLEV